MENEITLEEIILFVNKSQNDFIIHVEFGTEAERDAKEE